MLKIFVLDTSAESRQLLLESLRDMIAKHRGDLSLVPRVDLKSIARSEIKFQESPDILVIGSGIVREAPGDIANLRRDYPDSRILVRLSDDINDLATVEQLARAGADDTFTPQSNPDDVLRKLVLLGGKRRAKNHGRLILVDGGKGGVGCTTVAAAVAELIAVRGNKVALIDFDFESQDLSRFLQSRPFVNENLQLLFDEQRPVSQESVLQCLVQVFEAAGGSLSCMAPSLETETLYSHGAQYSRVLVSICETLDSLFDVVVVDVGACRGALLKTLYRVADELVYVLSNDPACLYSAADRLSRYRSLMAADARISCLVNCIDRSGLPVALVKNEFAAAVGLDSRVAQVLALPFCGEARRWPGSGATAAGLSARNGQRAFDALLVAIGYESAFSGRTSRVLEMLRDFWIAFVKPRQKVKNVAPSTAVMAIAPNPAAPQLLPAIGGNFLENVGASADSSGMPEREQRSAACATYSEQEWEPSKLVSGVSFR
ncbi:MAG: AAA family ATPase [Oligoflexia bacterium]|nr:AAA family ATPase [Oligoflexia bacterium]